MAYQAWKKYESEERWTSYFTQVDGVLHFQPSSCLEIGVGNGIVTQALKNNSIQVTTLDLDAALMPDLIGSVENIPFEDSRFDVVLCAEVLEHLPFSSFERCISEIARVACRGAILSLPHWGYTFRMIADVPGCIHARKAWKLPFHVRHLSGGEHQWEIGKKDFPPSRIRDILSKYFRIEREWLSPWMSYHRFYRLRKTG